MPSSSPFCIRTARQADLADLVDLLRQLTAIEADFDFDAAAHRAGLAALLAADPRQVRLVVAEAAGRAVAMASGQCVISTATGGPSVWVEDVVVQPAHRRQGIGRALLDDLAGWARSRGAARLQLLADADNAPALAFYDGLGFARTRFLCLRQMLPQADRAAEAPA